MHLSHRKKGRRRVPPSRGCLKIGANRNTDRPRSQRRAADGLHRGRETRCGGDQRALVEQVRHEKRYLHPVGRRQAGADVRDGDSRVRSTGCFQRARVPIDWFPNPGSQRNIRSPSPSAIDRTGRRRCFRWAGHCDACPASRCCSRFRSALWRRWRRYWVAGRYSRESPTPFPTGCQNRRYDDCARSEAPRALANTSRWCGNYYSGPRHRQGGRTSGSGLGRQMCWKRQSRHRRS